MTSLKDKIQEMAGEENVTDVSHLSCSQEPLILSKKQQMIDSLAYLSCSSTIWFSTRLNLSV